MRHQQHFLRNLSRSAIQIFPRITVRCLDSTSLNLQQAARFIKAEPAILTVRDCCLPRKATVWVEPRHRSKAQAQKALNVYSWFIYIHFNWHQLNKRLQVFITAFDSDCRFFFFFPHLTLKNTHGMQLSGSRSTFNPKVPLPRISCPIHPSNGAELGHKLMKPRPNTLPDFHTLSVAPFIFFLDIQRCLTPPCCANQRDGPWCGVGGTENMANVLGGREMQIESFSQLKSSKSDLKVADRAAPTPRLEKVCNIPRQSHLETWQRHIILNKHSAGQAEAEEALLRWIYLQKKEH